MVGTLSLERNFDYFTISGTNVRRDTFQELQGMVLGAGQNITWRSDFSITNTGFTLCVSFFDLRNPVRSFIS